MIRTIWSYGTSTPIQRVGVIILAIGLLSLFSWMIKEGLSFSDLRNPYYLPRSRDLFFFHLFFYLIPLGLIMSWGYQILIKIKKWVFSETAPDRDSSTPKTSTRYIPPKQNLHFENNLKAFQYAAKYYSPNFNSGQMSLGIVQNVIEHNSKYQFLIQLADSEKTTLAIGFNDKYAGSISKGNLVYWGFVEKVDDRDISAIGHVLATLYPELDPNNGRWTVKQDLTK